MRGKRALINTAINILNEIVHILSAFVLPRLILSCFGSKYNGIVSSITQFVSWISLLTAGITGATKASLYKPIANNDIKKISEIILATEKFVRKVSCIFLFILLLLAILYPFTVIENFNWISIFSLILIIGLGTAIQYYFGITYQILIEADQKKYLISGINIFTTILNTILSIMIINAGAGIHLLKFVNALVFAVNPLFVYFYSKKHYKLLDDVNPNYTAIYQRWDAFAQHMAWFVSSNTDIIIITLFLNIYEVSVYSIYYLVIRGIQCLLMAFISGFGPFFGDMLAKAEIKLIDVNTRIYENITFFLSTFVYSVTFLQITPFILLYTKGVTDIDYYRPIFGYIACFASYFQCIRTPYQTITESAGHFKQTRNGAVFEAVMNISLSLFLINRFGIVGVIFGTMLAGIFRTFQYSSYLYMYLISRKFGLFIIRIVLSLFSMCIIFIISQFIKLDYPNNYYIWAKNSCIFSLISLLITLSMNYIFYKDEMKMLHKKISNILIHLHAKC